MWCIPLRKLKIGCKKTAVSETAVFSVLSGGDHIGISRFCTDALQPADPAGKGADHILRGINGDADDMDPLFPVGDAHAANDIAAVFVENIVQAISRDLLCYSMRKLKDYEICAHVHDEVIVECGMEESLETVCKLMGEVPPWAKGLELRADGYETLFYKKD